MTKYTRIGQKYQINDRVKRLNQYGNYRYGIITDCICKQNRLNRDYYYYYVKWDLSTRPSLHSQNTLEPAEEDT